MKNNGNDSLATNSRQLEMTKQIKNWNMNSRATDVSNQYVSMAGVIKAHDVIEVESLTCPTLQLFKQKWRAAAADESTISSTDSFQQYPPAPNSSTLKALKLF